MHPETRKESWAVIQAFGAIYCCVIGTWALVHPPQTPVATSGNLPVTPATHIVWWFWVLIGGFIVCALTLAVGTVLNIVSRKVKDVENKIPTITVNGVPVGDTRTGARKPETVDEILSGLPQQQSRSDDERRLREHLRDAEQRADRLLKESKQLDDEKAALQKNNQELKGRISEVEQRWNNSALLSGQFLQEAATLSGDLILVWLREHCPTKTQFSSASMAENLGISRDAALHGLELLQRQYKLVTRPLQNVDGWEYIPSLTALQPTLKATTRLSKPSNPSLTSSVFVFVDSLSADPPQISRGKRLTIRYMIESSEDLTAESIWLGASLIAFGKGVSNPPQDKPISLSKGKREYDREFMVPASTPLGKHVLRANVWWGPLSDPKNARIVARGCPVGITVVE